MYEKLDNAVSLINQWKALSAEVQQLKGMMDYLNTPIMDKHTYGLTYPSGGRTALSVTSAVMATVSVLGIIALVILLAINFSNSSSTASYYDYSYSRGNDPSNIGFFFIIPGVMLFVSAILGTIASVMKGSAYSEYYNKDVQYREYCYAQSQGYQEKCAKLQQLENLLNNPQVCEIPRQYWNQADMIVTLIKSGTANNVPDAIVKLGIVRY